jgi:hypothetical protein
MSVLIDTSVWSLLFRRDRHKLNASELVVLDSLRELVQSKRTRVIGPIRQELLSGIKDTEQRELLQQRFREFEDEVLITADYEMAAEMSCKCRSAGIAVGSIDALICSVATLRTWQIFTRDIDFEYYGKVLPLQFHRPA